MIYNTSIIPLSPIILFGLPGTGKSYAGKILRDHFGYFVHDGDNNLPVDMKQAIESAQPVTDRMRDRFFQQLIVTTRKLVKLHNRLVITQTFIKEKYRKQIHEYIPETTFILVETDTLIREKRLHERKEYPIDSIYARNMVMNFDIPKISHMVLKNNEVGELNLIQQFEKLLGEKNM